MFKIAIQLSVFVLLVIAVLTCGGNQERDIPLVSDYTGRIPTDELIQLIIHARSNLMCYLAAELAGERGSEALPALLDALRHSDAFRWLGTPECVITRPVEGAFWAIGKIRDPRSIPVLVELYKEEPHKYGRALLTLRQFGGDAVVPLLDILKHSTGDVRASAVIRTLGEIDEPRAIQALQEIASHRDSPYWLDAARALAMRKDEAGRSARRLALSDPEMASFVLRMPDEWLPRKYGDDKMLLPLYFEYLRSDEESWSRMARLGIARNAGKAELPRIAEEGLDKTWVMPFVEINCATEGIDSESEKANILWQYVTVPQYELLDDILGHSITVGFYPDKYMQSFRLSPINYAVERLAELGDAALPVLEAGMRSDKEHIRIRAIMALAQTPPSEASTELLLKVWDNPINDDNWEFDLIVLEYVVNELGNRKEKRAVPKLLEMLSRMGEAKTGEEISAMFSAIEALGKIGDKRAWDEMLKIWMILDPGPSELEEPGHSPARAIKSASAVVLSEVFNEWKLAESAVIPLMYAAILDDRMEDHSFSRKRPAFQTLVRIGDPSIEALRQLSESENPRIRGIVRDVSETALKILLWH